MKYDGCTRIRRRTHTARSMRKKTPRNRVRPNYVLLFSLFFMSVLITGIASFALHTPSLAVAKVRVMGVRLSDKAAVQRMADHAKGQNIITLRKSPIIKSIARLGEVKKVEMGRSFPNGAWVRVWERTPDAVLQANGHFIMIQLNGFIFHQTNGPVKGVPLVIVAKCDEIKSGTYTTSPCIRYALDALACARKEGIKLDKISVDPQGDICLNMGSDFYVKLGQPDDIQRKMSLLKNTLVYRPSIARKASYVDLSCPSAPVWKPKMVAEAAS